MSKIVIIVILIVLVLALIFVAFAHNLVRDKVELEHTPLEKKFETVIQEVNAGLLGSGGKTVTFPNDKRHVNLFNDNSPNQIINFLYSTGNLSITYKYKFFQQEMVFERLFKGVRNINIYNQTALAKEFVGEALQRKSEHEHKVLSDIEGFDSKNIDLSGDSENPVNIMAKPYESFTKEQRMSVAVLFYIIGLASHKSDKTITEDVTFRQMLLPLHLKWDECYDFYIRNGEDCALKKLKKLGTSNTTLKSRVLYNAMYMAKGDDFASDSSGFEKLVDCFCRIGFSEDELNNEIEKLGLVAKLLSSM
ncbi:MAG: hypothetical protein J6T86_00355 [Bacteroidales bacterium]|nr:hypothetical protein [Bacteroidales bacterium]